MGLIIYDNDGTSSPLSSWGDTFAIEKGQLSKLPNVVTDCKIKLFFSYITHTLESDTA